MASGDSAGADGSGARRDCLGAVEPATLTFTAALLSAMAVAAVVAPDPPPLKVATERLGEKIRGLLVKVRPLCPALRAGDLRATLGLLRLELSDGAAVARGLA